MRPLLYVSILSALALTAACNKGDTTKDATPTKAKSEPAKDKPSAAPMVKEDKPEAQPAEVKKEEPAKEKADDFDSDGGEPEGAPPSKEQPGEPGEPEELEEPE